MRMKAFKESTVQYHDKGESTDAAVKGLRTLHTKGRQDGQFVVTICSTGENRHR